MYDSGSQAAEIVFNAMRKEEENEKIEASVPDCYCPKCRSADVNISETFEDGSGMTFFSLVCSDCGSRFVLLEDLINSLRRKEENAIIAANNARKQLEEIR